MTLSSCGYQDVAYLLPPASLLLPRRKPALKNLNFLPPNTWLLSSTFQLSEAQSPFAHQPMRVESLCSIHATHLPSLIGMSLLPSVLAWPS